VYVELFMCHKHEMMEHFYSKVGRSHRSFNPATRNNAQVPGEILPPNDVVLPHDDDILDEGSGVFTRSSKHRAPSWTFYGN